MSNNSVSSGQLKHIHGSMLGNVFEDIWPGVELLINLTGERTTVGHVMTRIAREELFLLIGEERGSFILVNCWPENGEMIANVYMTYHPAMNSGNITRYANWEEIVKQQMGASILRFESKSFELFDHAIESGKMPGWQCVKKVYEKEV